MRGVRAAIGTRFAAAGDIECPAFRRVIELQIAAKVDGVVVCGSTGEGATLTMQEKVALWNEAVQQATGRCIITAGTGTNDTRTTIEQTQQAKEAGVDAVLIVTPYYNKPTPAGLMAHFRALNDAVDIRQILYNVPGRTGQNVSATTQLSIAESFPNVIATKEASANLEQMCEIIRHAPAHFSLLAGDDVLTLPAIACGATGVIAVISNYAPIRFGRLVHAILGGDVLTAQREQMALMPYFAANFFESNPLPVKIILSLLGMIEAEYRLPLTMPTEQTQQRLRELMRDFVDA